MTTDEFVHQVTKPLYVYRMARANKDSPNPSMRKSAHGKEIRLVAITNKQYWSTRFRGWRRA